MDSDNEVPLSTIDGVELNMKWFDNPDDDHEAAATGVIDLNDGARFLLSCAVDYDDEPIKPGFAYTARVSFMANGNAINLIPEGAVRARSKREAQVFVEQRVRDIAGALSEAAGTTGVVAQAVMNGSWNEAVKKMNIT